MEKICKRNNFNYKFVFSFDHLLSEATQYVYKPFLLPSLFQNLCEVVEMPKTNSDLIIDRPVINPCLSFSIRQRRLQKHEIIIIIIIIKVT